AVVLGDDFARQHLVACIGGASPEAPVAVTHIERAAGCPFVGFARRVLRVRRTEDMDEAGDPRERGTLVHRALQAAFEAARGTSPDDVDRILAAARAAAERALGAEAPLAPLRREAVRRAITDALRVVARALASPDGFRFYAGERRFGAGEPAAWGALELT